ncbi:Panacea domain-containing protein [Rhodoferax sp. TBRC 17660]|uniref:Panacea domain-containing protein n=1 Tax=Rhodoferax potami TaxID=3068338 RepID=A0ABU3KSR0_9BURK|nr:Panacea domain-containing protein [Rhodoferax sp. TBRC 17660]MDT7520700.1 Panacea domain-containing protein [Rhodoferax sp. TBRC 17660]
MALAPLFDERRAAEAAAFLLFRAGGRLPLIKLIKLMYLSERLSLQRYGEPITGDRLVAMPNGPVLSMTYEHINGARLSIEGGWETWIADRAGHEVALRDESKIRSPEQDLLRLSDSDLEVLGETWNEFGHWDRWDLVKYTHSDACPEWEDPDGSSRPIAYDVLFTKLGYSQDQASSLMNRLAEQRQLNAAMC